MPICAMVGCPTRSRSANRPDDGRSLIGLYCLPKVITWQCERTRMLSEKRRALWFERINRRDLMNPKHLRVCGRHFLTGRPSRLMDDKNPDWAPSLYLGYGPFEQLAGESCNCFQCLNKSKGKKMLAVVPGLTPCQSFLHDESLPSCRMDSKAACRSPPTAAKAAGLSSQQCCAVVGCSHTRRKRNLLLQETCPKHGRSRSSCTCGVYSLHRFPSTPESLQDWLTALNRENFVPSKASRVCSIHFVDGKPTPANPVPTLHLGHSGKVVVGRLHYIEAPSVSAASSDRHLETDSVLNYGCSLGQIPQESPVKYPEPKFGAHQTSAHTQCSDLDLSRMKRNASAQVAISLNCDAVCQADATRKDAAVQCRGLCESAFVEYACACESV